mgnify:CR=1 FL=1
MNIFCVSCCPTESAQQLPDRHVTKMALECCQMISVIYSSWHHDWGTIPKKDGNPYATKKGAFRNHPCTQWAAASDENLAWLIKHGLALCDEFEYRFDKKHACKNTLIVALEIFKDRTKKSLECWRNVKNFVRAMPDEMKYDTSIDTIEAYRRYVVSKEWTLDDYKNRPERKPTWMML